MLLHDLLTRSARRNPEKTAVRDSKGSLLYKELDEQSNYLAQILIENGCTRNDNVGIFLDKSIYSIVSIFGVLKAGACYVPFDTSAPLGRLEYISKDAHIRILISETRKIPDIKKISAHYRYSSVLLMDRENDDCHKENEEPYKRITFDHRGNTRSESSNPPLEEESPAYILYTSGSTGYPKGVVLSHRNALCFVEWAYEYFAISPSDIFSSHAPLHFDLSIFDIFVSIMAAAQLCLLPKGISSFPRSLGMFLEKHKITTWYSVPSILVHLLFYGNLESLRLDSIQRIIYAGEPFPMKYLKELIRLIPHARFYNLYGPTETNVITCFQIPKRIDQMNDEIPIGSPCPYADIRVIKENGDRARKNEKGELIVKGGSLMRGYLNKPESTEGVMKEVCFSNGEGGEYYCTGDIVKVIDDDLLQFICRKDNMIKKNGFRIEIEEIEATLLRHDSVKECAVKVLDDGRSKRLKAYIVSDRKMEKSGIIHYAAQYLPQYMIPDEIEFRDYLVKSSRGKIDRHSL